MLHSSFGGAPAAEPFPSYQYDRFYDNTYNTQLALSQVTQRLSRASAGAALRVVKPSSTSTSPRSSAAKSRRRTIINDSHAARRQQQVLEYISSTQDTRAFVPRRQSRPVSWHPSSHLQTPQVEYIPQQTFYEYPTMQHGYHTAFQPSPPMASYSNSTSPSSNFSPLPLSYQANEAMTTSSADEWQAANQSAPYYPTLADNQYLNGAINERSPTDALNWNSYIYQGFSETSPPTPDSFLPSAQQPQADVPEASIQTLDESEEEGEILIGMGLYDTPGKYEEDPHLNNYRSTVSSLLGSSFKHQEPTGKGLKLEETWEPPKSDDEDEDGEEEEEDDDN
ncbi:uncharacterized protein TrAFT101_008939 [Trichoderma asperellum]|uniref:Uncharacterized protein n=1 Tax=Trichoderma asperellum (strain ATCC 204424 / CBS 433.97 / NBRC 101777) TaxID=1042311 RepID=A0A2T3ZAW9_TRIA4|nr:hypothetical protein M441DRAFT_45690 [Trichoderma asperellum CBS 433.97]PTB41958.1 hypothetical protein M441DRAFT_45690 [Trichoderma asperellum CBS 433.97]UKZ94045.1 hypothetical protein TrAFT101_008939 [Trichoderma asperellum]